MSPDTKLILDAMSKLFDKVDARWAKQDAVREASRGVPVPTQSDVVGADPVVDNRRVLFDGGDDSDEQHHEEPIVADNWGGLFEQPAHFQEERDLGFPDAPTPKSCLTSTNPYALVSVAPAMSSSLSSAPSPAPAARAADEENTTSITPSRCLMQVHSSDTTLIASPTSCGSSVGTNMHNAKVSADLLASSDCSMQVPRYITSMTPSLCNGFVLSCVAIGGHEYKVVLESMSIQSTIIFCPVRASVFDKEKWPPPMHLNMQRTDAQLRPIPWPSFGYWNVHCASCQHNKDRNSVLWFVWKIPWLFSVLVFSNSEALAAVTVITRTHMLFQYLSTLHRPISMHNDDGIFRWPQTQIIGDSVHAHKGSDLKTTYYYLSNKVFRNPITINFSSSTAEITVLVLLTVTVGESMKGHILQVAVLEWSSGWCEFVVAKVSGRIVGVPYCPFLVHQLTSIVAIRQLFLWDPSGDRYLFAELESSNGLADLQMQDADLSVIKLREWLVSFQFLSCLHWPSRMDSDDMLLAYFPRQGHGVFILYLIQPPDDTWSQHIVSAVLDKLYWLCHDQVLSLTVIQCYEWDVKLHLYWRCIVLPEGYDCEADRSMIVVLLHEFLQLTYYTISPWSYS